MIGWLMRTVPATEDGAWFLVAYAQGLVTGALLVWSLS